MQDDLEKVLIDEARIRARIREMASRITAGAMIFAADLIRAMPIRMKINLMTVSSYPGQALRTQGSSVVSQQLGDVSGRNVLLVDDILDSGGTLKLVAPHLLSHGAASVRTCVLLRKDRPSAREVQADYVGFDIPDEFVVGYGLDYDNVYRNLPEICTLKPSVYAAS
jgi:hypoxanthine phosphoribosyltransferase